MKKQLIAYLIAAIGFGVYYGLFAAMIPTIGDSLMLLDDYLAANGGSPALSLGALKDFMLELRATDNSRLSNLLFIIVQVLDNPVATGITAGAVALLFAAGALAVTGRRPKRAAAMMMVVVLLFPWRESTIAFCNYMNTMLPASVTLLMLGVLRHSRTRQPGAAGIVFALLAGMVHESYSAALLCGIAACAAIFRGRLGRGFYMVSIVYLAGTVAVISAPGLWLRAANAAGSVITLKGIVSVVLPEILAGIIAIGAAATRGGRMRIRELLHSPMGVIVVVTFAASAALALASGMANPRALWLPALTATLAAITVAGKWVDRLGKGVIAAAGILTAIFCGNILLLQQGYTRTLREIERSMSASKGGTVYFNIDIFTPRSAMLQPVKNPWAEELHLQAANRRRMSGQIFAVVPDSLRLLTAAQVRAINSGHHPGKGFSPVGTDGRLWRFGSMILGPDTTIVHTLWDGSRERATAEFQPGRIVKKFVTADGDSLTWIHRPGLRASCSTL